MEFQVNTEKKQKGVFIVSPVGPVDSDTYTLLEEKVKPLLKSTINTLVFDMKDVTYISSAGLAVIFNTKKSLKKHGAAIALINLQPQVKKVFDIIKALPKQNIFENFEEVDNYLNAMQKDEIERQKE